ncbi:MAG: potassium-transporting ATPase subunit KdpA, partial [Acidobacteriota bacterium]|nr:potassium-transporting ATPase subunit KdpA [Acidobacteriota bacterium]
MTANGWIQIAIFFLLILACTKPLGSFIANVIEGRRNFLTPILGPVERLIYRICGVPVNDEGQPGEQHWTRYAGSLLAFSAFSAILLYVIQRLQIWFPFNPQAYGAGNVSPDLGFNTAVSFTTNTNWQSYVPETTLSYFVQMAGLTVHNFASAAAGLAIAIALVRGFARQSVQTIGNFWADMTRTTLYVLMPLSIVAALVLCSQGVIQNLHPYTVATTLEGAKQTIAQGPVASQEAIKMLGTNGGGFFNANSAHPFENPTPFSNMF